MAHSYADSMEEELTCCVCFELFVDPHTPKDLNCPHVICEVCLKCLVKDSAIDCPQCRVVTRLSKDGVAALKTNLGIRNLAEKHQKHLEKQEQQSHPLWQSRTQDDQVPVCPDHGEKMHFYCVTCDSLVCHSCTVVGHLRPQHQIEDVKILRREKLKLSDATISKLEQDILQYEKKSREISGTEHNILSSIKTEERKIDRSLAFLVQEVEKACEQGDALKAELRQKNDPKLNLCQKKKFSLQKKVHELRSIIIDNRAVAEVTSINNFLLRHKAMMDKIKALPAHIDEGLVQYQPGEVEFKAEQLALKLGTITVKQSNQSAVKKRNAVGLVRKIKQTGKLKGFNMTVISMASNRSGDILAISEGNTVHIYCKQSNGQYKKQSSLNVTGSQFDSGHCCYVAIAADGKYLLANGRSMHVYSTSGQYLHVCYTAPADTNYGEAERLSCITTTKDGRIIAGDWAQAVITVHTPDGMTLLKTINTSIQPVSIAAINNTHVAISRYSAHKVCVIDLESGRETLRIDIDEPTAVCYDEETDCLLISRDNGMMDQHSLLTGHKIACTARNLVLPNAMIFIDDGMLAVQDGNAVNLYAVSVFSATVHYSPPTTVQL